MSRCGGGRGDDGGARGRQDNTGPESRGSEFEPLTRQLVIFHLLSLVLKWWGDHAVFAVRQHINILQLCVQGACSR